jgi:CubicO group peptidase (beta-lactamase class C family)
LSAICFGSSRLHAQTSGKLASSVQPFVDRQELAGAVMLVADKDKVLAAEAVGWADVAARKPMQADSLFWIASQSKPITAAALMMLADGGKVNVEDSVEKHLPEFRGQMVVVEKDADHVLLRRPKHPITVRNVLSHTSGLPFKSALEEPTLDLFPLVARVRSYAMTPLEFDPDSKYQYSNAGVNTAARIIEVVAKTPFERFLDERLFQPLGMKDTNSYGFGFAVGPASFGHGGAYSTNTTADTRRGLILVWLVQHAGFPGQGNKSQDAFQRAAFEAFAPAKK